MGEIRPNARKWAKGMETMQGIRRKIVLDLCFIKLKTRFLKKIDFAKAHGILDRGF